uniref:Uncharacterized protein n=1 Tax=Arundo donax TaxID=35708 RepID=A0A0A9F8N3_ARUDO
MIVLSFLLAPSSFSSATTATGSVALSNPPSNNDVFQLQSYGKASFTAVPSKNVDITTPGPASNTICAIHLFIWCISIEKELSNKRAGRNTAKRRSGFMLAQIRMPAPSLPRPCCVPYSREPRATPRTRRATV